MWKRANAVLVLSALLVACTSTSNDQDAAAPSGPAATASDPALAHGSCGDDGDGQTVVAGIDLDGDGLEDRAWLNEADQLLVVCLGNGQTALGSTDDEGWVGPHTAIEAVDLGGTPGIALIHEGGSYDREVIFVRWFEGRLGALDGNPQLEPSEVPQLGSGVYWGEGRQPYALVYGCRPATLEPADPEAKHDFEIAQLDAYGGYVETFFSLHSERHPTPRIEVETDQDRSDLTKRDLEDVLRDQGFTPRCSPGA